MIQGDIETAFMIQRDIETAFMIQRDIETLPAKLSTITQFIKLEKSYKHL